MEDIYGSMQGGLSEDGDDGSSRRRSSNSGSDSDSTGTADEDGADVVPAEVTALCWSNGGVGVARYLCAECRIEVFEAPVCVVAGEALRRPLHGNADRSSLSSRRGGDGGVGGEGEVRILVCEDIPPSLLWLVRYLAVHRPQVLLPHEGSDALGDLIRLVAATAAVPLEVIRLSAATAFSAAEALPRLAAMYPAHATELKRRFHAERRAMMRSMAALLQFVAVGQSNVADVVERGVPHALYLEEACAEALQITRTERHPSSAQGRGRAKEGLSLRSVLGAAQSPLGRAMLRQWTALPCCDVAEIDARQSVVAFFAHAEHSSIAQHLRTALHGVRSTSHIFTVMRSGRALRKHYVSLHRTIRGVVQVHRLLSTVAHHVPRLHVLLQSIVVEPLTGMAHALARTVAGVAGQQQQQRAGVQNRVRETLPSTAPDMTEGSRVHICDGVDAALDELRLRLHELRLSLQSKAEAAFAQLPWEMRARLSLRCAYAVPHGYLLCVPADELVAVVSAVAPPEALAAEAASSSDADSDLPFRTEGENSEERKEEGETAVVGRAGLSYPPLLTSATAPTADAATAKTHAYRFMADAFHWRFHHETHTRDVCFKSAAMEELDTWVGDLQRRVQQREQQVRRDLDTALLVSSLHLLRPTSALGELDCLLSFARVSAQEGWCRPEVVEGGRAGRDASLDGEKGEEEEEEEGVLEIENGWHPLLSRQLGLQQLIPFSLRLRTSTDRVCVVLGVNGSGKSVLIGAVAHIVFLAHVGCHVPAAAARMSLIEGIFAPSSSASACPVGSRSIAAVVAGGGSTRYCGSGRPGDPNCNATAAAAQAELEAAQSSFYGECVALHRTLHHVAGQQRVAASTPVSVGRALVLLDEFGRGTAPEDGCALLKATLSFFASGGRSPCDGSDFRTVHDDASMRRSRWPRAPLVLCATHLVEMFDSPRRTVSTTSLLRGDGCGGGGGGGPQSLAAGDSVLPLEWVKLYEMEAHTTFAPDSLTRSAAAATGGDDSDDGAAADAAGRRVPLDVVPTFQAVCITPDPGPCRWEAWERHAGGKVAAGPALGRQCGLDADLLASWTSALRVLQRAPS